MSKTNIKPLYHIKYLDKKGRTQGKYILAEDLSDLKKWSEKMKVKASKVKADNLIPELKGEYDVKKILKLKVIAPGSSKKLDQALDFAKRLLESDCPVSDVLGLGYDADLEYWDDQISLLNGINYLQLIREQIDTAIQQLEKTDEYLDAKAFWSIVNKNLGTNPSID